jgi:hypothetical protein
MDLMDDAQEREEELRQKALTAAREAASAAPIITATGECLCCHEPLEPPKRWCNVVCRDGWERSRR